MSKQLNAPISTQLVRILDYIYRKGLDTPCILLVRGNDREMIEIKHTLQQTESLCATDYNVHSVCGLLISHINSVPPIIPTEITSLCLNMESKDISSILYKKLPTYNYNTFYYILSFLRELLNHSDKNGLCSDQLAQMGVGMFVPQRDPYSTATTPIVEKFTGFLKDVLDLNLM
ncbi:Rho-GAP domain-containing protein [Entamoeba marina]